MTAKKGHNILLECESKEAVTNGKRESNSLFELLQVWWSSQLPKIEQCQTLSSYRGGREQARKTGGIPFHLSLSWWMLHYLNTCLMKKVRKMFKKAISLINNKQGLGPLIQRVSTPASKPAAKIITSRFGNHDKHQGRWRIHQTMKENTFKCISFARRQTVAVIFKQPIRWLVALFFCT